MVAFRLSVEKVILGEIIISFGSILGEVWDGLEQPDKTKTNNIKYFNKDQLRFCRNFIPSI